MKKLGCILLVVLVGVALVFSCPVQAKENPPKPGKMKKLSFPSFKEFKTKNNIDVVVVEHHEQPVVTIAVVIKSGSTLDSEGKFGLSDFVVSLLNKGTKDKDSNELATWIESVGGSVNLDSGSDFTTISVSILSEYITTAYEYLQDIISNPVFPEDELEEYRKRIKTALEIEKSQPAAVARRYFSEVVYGEHPYAGQPSVESVEAITRKDIEDFYNKNFVANHALITVVGDVKWKKVRKSIEKYFGSWEEGSTAVVEYVSPPEIASNQIYLYHKPGAVQTNILIGHTGLKATNPDWPTVITANRILGGGADARLFMNLREDKGWTYGAYSNFSNPKDTGFFRARVEVRTEVTDSALVELMGELKRIVDEPVPQEELDNAKNYLVGNFPTTIETPDQIASQVVRVKLLGLGKKYLEEYRERVAKVGVEDVGRMMKEYLHPDNAAIILVGDATAIHEKVEEIAPVELFDLDGKRLSLAELTVEPVHYEYDTSPLNNMQATYSISMQTMSLGDMKVDFKRTQSEGQEVFQVTNSISGMLMLDETIEFRCDDFAPIMCKSQMIAGPNKMESNLVFKDGKVTGTVKGMQAKEATEVSKSIVDGTILDDELEFVLAVLPLEVNKTYRFPVLQSNSGGLSNVHVEVISEDRITVPAGSFSTYKIKIKGSEGESFIYAMKKTPHLLVKQEMPAQGLVIELKELSK